MYRCEDNNVLQAFLGVGFCSYNNRKLNIFECLIIVTPTHSNDAMDAIMFNIIIRRINNVARDGSSCIRLLGDITHKVYGSDKDEAPFDLSGEALSVQ